MMIITPLVGILLWKLNKIWPTGGWGLVEHGIHTDDSNKNNMALGER